MGCRPFCPVASRFSSSLEQAGRFGSRQLVSQSVECSLREVVSLSYGAPRVAPCVRSAAHRVARRVRSGAPCGAPCQGCQWWVVVCAGVWAPACDAVRTTAGAARPSTAAHPMRERARRREIKSEVMISLISITPMSVVQQNPWLVRIFDRSTNVD